MTIPRPRRVSVLLFDGFELLDVFGPVELLSMLPDRVSVDFVGVQAGPVRSSQGAEVIAPRSLADAATERGERAPDILLVPGGMGTRRLVDDRETLDALARWAASANLVTSVCTGSAVLAAAGLLEGHRATSNKLAFGWARGHGDDVEWMPSARWVEDGDRWTSSGVAAGMDMTAALIGRLFGDDVALEASNRIELETHPDPAWDPFAALNGLV